MVWCYYYCEPSDYVVWSLTRTGIKKYTEKFLKSPTSRHPDGTGRDGQDRTGQDGRTDGRDEVGEKRNQSLRGNNTKIFRRNALKQTANYVDCQV